MATGTVMVVSAGRVTRPPDLSASGRVASAPPGTSWHPPGELTTMST